MTIEEATGKVSTALDRQWPEWRNPNSEFEWLRFELFADNGRLDYQIDASRGRVGLAEAAIRDALGESAGKKLN